MSRPTLYAIWSEWDIGHEDIVFDTEAEALAYAKTAYEENPGDESWDEVFEQALIGTKEIARG